ncbi:MAG: TIGR04219 family outer membrane beta-barrel protein [Psychromonas sp.]
MKKKFCAIALIATFSMPLMADFLGVYAGIDYRTIETSVDDNGSGFEDSNNLSGYLAIEHFIPLIPNVKLKYADLTSESSSTSNDASSSVINTILYYELFDNDLFELDLGLAYSRLESVRDQSADIAQAYGAAKVHLPGMGMHVFAEVISGSFSDDEASDATLGLAYTFNPDSLLINLSVRAGYRYQEIIIDNVNQESKGLFAGLEAHF